MNKNQAMLDYLAQFPGLQSYLFFNSVTDEIGNTSVQTVYSEEWEKQYVRGHGIKHYDFAVVQIREQDPGTSDNNARQIQDVQEFMDWIDAQDKARNFPDFGPGARVMRIANLQNMPNFAGTNEAGNMAKYMFQCRVTYTIE